MSELSAEAIEGMVAYYRRQHTKQPCPHCNKDITPDRGFACVDCERIYHRECLRKHCAGEREELIELLKEVRVMYEGEYPGSRLTERICAVLDNAIEEVKRS